MAAEDDDDEEEEEDEHERRRRRRRHEQTHNGMNGSEREKRSWTLARYDEPDCWCTRYTSVVLTTSRSTERKRERTERGEEKNRLAGKKEAGRKEARGE